MRIGIVGGTGKEGVGLGLRWAKAGHEVIIGSRDAERARAKAAELAGPGLRVDGKSNREAAAAAEVVALTVPATGLAATLPELREACRGKVVISTVVRGRAGAGAAGSRREGGGGLPPHRGPRALRGRPPDRV
jgi:NADPH-dependent F420 reductase